VYTLACTPEQISTSRPLASSPPLSGSSGTRSLWPVPFRPPAHSNLSPGAYRLLGNRLIGCIGVLSDGLWPGPSGLARAFLADAQGNCRRWRDRPYARDLQWLFPSCV